MAQLRVYQIEAVVIRRIKLGESDRILTLYTPGKGKMKAVAKGARRTISKLGGHVEMLTHSRLLIAQGRNLDIITQAQTIDSYIPLRNDLNRLSQGLYCAELIDAFTVENVENDGIFRLLCDTLLRLSDSEKNTIALRYFELHLLNLSGFRPQLQTCVICGKRIQPAINYFNPSQGGVICPDCDQYEMLARKISLNALKVLRLWQNCDFTIAARININAELERELELLLRDYLKFILEKQIKSTQLLDNLKGKLQNQND